MKVLIVLLAVVVASCLACSGGGGGCCCCAGGAKNLALRGKALPLGGEKLMPMAGGNGGPTLLAGSSKGFIAPHGLLGSAAPAETPKAKPAPMIMHMPKA